MPHLLRVLPVVALATTTLALPAQVETINAFEGAVTMRTWFVQGHSGNLAVQVKWPRERLDYTGSEGEKATVVYDFDAGSRTVIDPKKKQYYVVNIGQRAQALREAMADHGLALRRSAAIVVTPTNKTDNVVGKTCKYYSLGTEKLIDVCVASGLGEFMVDEQMSGSRAMGGTVQTDTLYDDLGSSFPGGYFPLKIISRASGTARTVLQVMSIERKQISDDVFKVPGGYTKTEAPHASN
jgi:hypothetical protein